MRSVMVIVPAIAVEGEAPFSDREVRLTFVKSGYMLGTYIQKLTDVVLNN